MGKITASGVKIEPSDNDGFAMWIRPTEVEGSTWWKWYASEHAAYVEAETLGFAISEMLPDADRHLRQVRRTLKLEVEANPETLARFSFRRL